LILSELKKAVGAENQKFPTSPTTLNCQNSAMFLRQYSEKKNI